MRIGSITRNVTCLSLGVGLCLASVPAASASAQISGAATASREAPARVGSPGTQSAGDVLFPSIGNGGYDVRHYDIRLDYISNTKISAVTTIDAQATKPLSSFSLDLQGLQVDSVRVDGRVAGVTRHDTKLVVTPIRPVLGRFATVIRYHGAPVTHTDPDGSPDGWIKTPDGATVQSEPVGAMTWFPDNNTPRDKATFRVSVDAPSAVAVAGNGTLDTRRRGARTTWTWTQRQPIATYLAMVSIGRYRVYHSMLRLASGRTIPVWSFIDPSFSGTSAKQRSLIKPILRFEESHYGPYPFASAGIVVDNTKSGYALENASRPVFDSPPDVLTEVHEFGHQWYGDSVTPKQWMDVWMNEGFADYTEKLWTETHGGATARQAYQKIFDTKGPDSSLWSPAPATFSDPADLFGSPVYTRGGMTLEALRLRVGDRAFFTILRRWAARERGRSVTTAPFISLAEQVSGQQLDGLFQTWLYEPKKPAKLG